MKPAVPGLRAADRAKPRPVTKARHLGSVSTETLTAVSRYLHLFIV